MRQVNLENVKEAGDFERLGAGGYVCRIMKVTDVPVNPTTGKGDYLQIEYDIAEGDLKDYYKKMEANLKFWGGRFICSYKEKALPMFKRMCSAIAKSNPGFIFDGGRQNADEQTLVGKLIGLVLGEEEYIGNDGALKTRVYVYSQCDISDIRRGDFKIPKMKPLPGNNTNGNVSDGFIYQGTDEEVPFN